MKHSVVMACALGLGWLLPRAQDPQPAPAPSVPAQEQPAPRHPLEGVYQLRRRMHAGEVDPRAGTGYLALTRNHMLLCLAGPGTDPELPLVRAGVRSWKQDGDVLETEVKLGFFSDADGVIRVERRAERSKRRVEIARGLLRIFQDDRSYLEFERVE